ncbi:MAG: hypothetical protein A3H93_14330 [Rhodocyclales bacterium RIFCSPLOWO2_02_FULL_63_24]|nr:MAG: hypothetical protein A3H93_14330 [Rhodocyclales bacterium RIFCSPLOWO2_02_FULL_63_24]
MNPKRFLLDFEVESHACLADGHNPVRTAASGGGIELFISNLNVTSGTDRPLLSVHLVQPAENIEAAKEAGTQYLKDYLNYLSFLTNLPCRIHKLLRVVDWTLGINQRDCHQFERFPGSELPYPVLEKPIFDSLEELLSIPTTPAHRRALKWFSAGVSAEYADDQFQYFWLVVELIAQIDKIVDKIHDQCATCHGPLFCQTCNEFPTHRPYPKQAIRHLLEQTMPAGAAEFLELASDIRNAIMRGDDVAAIESAKGVELASVVNTLGGVARTALLNILLHNPEDRRHIDQLALLKTTVYAHQRPIMTAHLLVYSADPNDPKLSEIAPFGTSLAGPDTPKTS